SDLENEHCSEDRHHWAAQAEPQRAKSPDTERTSTFIALTHVTPIAADRPRGDDDPPGVCVCVKESPPRELSRLLRPNHELGGVFEDLGDVGEDARTEAAVDEAVVDTQRELGHLTGLDLALVDPGLLAHGTEGEDRGLARVQDRCAGVDAERADIGDRDRAIRQVSWRGLASTRGERELSERLGELAQRE